VGAGGLGSPAIIYLAAAGVGTLGVADPDRVELSNLHRQVLHFTGDQKKSKVASAREKIQQLNPDVAVRTHETLLSAKNALDIIRNYDLVIDGTDNFPARYLINDACVMLKKPFVFGGILRFEGQVSVFGLEGGPCYRCFFPDPPRPGDVPSCAEAGVIGILPGIIGLIQANEAVKILCRIGEPLKGRLLIFDALETRFREIRIPKDPSCAMCGSQRTIHTLTDVELACADQPEPQETKGKTMFGLFGKKDAPQEISVQELKREIDRRDPGVCLVDVREKIEWDVARIEGAILKPMSTFENDYQDIPKDKTVYLYCKVGGRSRNAAQFLRSKGYKNVFNVKGGIDAWAREIDPQMRRY